MSVGKSRLFKKMAKIIKADNEVYERPDRRVPDGFHLPEIPQNKSKSNITFAFDTSGGITDGEIKSYKKQALNLLKERGLDSANAIYFDATVVGEFEVSSDSDVDELMKTVVGGGGTLFDCVFDWTSENGCSELYIFTDGFGSVSKDIEPTCSVTWVGWESKDKPPFGKVVNSI